ncbi:MAG: hypothetical protein M1150_03260 [Patescibacteria group bacterium]|nr:hypothetical protein [Patescibacteria group bacterium]
MKLPKELTTVTNTSKILAGIVFITLPFIAFFAGTYYQASITPKSTDNTSVSTSKTSTSSASPSATANWKTTTLEKLLFKTPSSWYFQQEQKGKNGSKSIAFAPEDPGGSIDTPLSYNLSFVPNTTITNQKQKDANNIYMTIEEDNAVSISGLNFTIISGLAIYPSEKKAAIAFVQYGEDVYSLYTPGGDDLTFFNQILSTFKFTDQNQTEVSIPNSWSTFNKVVEGTNFKLRYPKEFTVKERQLASNSSEGVDLLNGKGSSAKTVASIYLYRDFQYAYKGESRREWLKKNLSSMYSSWDFSNLIFEEISFSNGKSYLKVSGWPQGLSAFNNSSYYMGVQNSLPFYVTGSQYISTEDMQKVLSSVEVSK